MKGKVVFVNTNSRLAAVSVGQKKYVVFEYESGADIQIDEEYDGLRNSFGSTMIRCAAKRKSANVNVLSSAMSFDKAKLVVAPWHEDFLEEATSA